tara:strand:- start:5161 stop:5424 length:264 start_codon:yes stop_codon:yes gene_type:complete
MLTNKVAQFKEHDTLSPSLNIELDSPECLKEGLGFLLNRYLENQSRMIAKKIVIQLEKLLQHSDCIGFPNERCIYYRLLKHWQAKCL